MLKKTVFSLLFLVMTACSFSPFKLTGESYPPYSGKLIVFTESPDSTSFEEIGIIKSRYNSSRDWAEIIEKTKQTAAQNGANAIIIIKKGKDCDYYILPIGDMLIPVFNDYKYIKAMAIRYN